jgi:SAM-dependent methyltransferase
MSRYTHGHQESVLRSHLWRTVDNSAAYLAERLSPGVTVLDVGSGPGNLTVDLARRVAPGRVIGIDNSEAIIARAVGGVPEGIDNVEFHPADVYRLPFPDDAFDVVHAHQVLQHLDDPVAALTEMRRVCRPGGIVAARDVIYATMVWFPADERLERWREIYRTVAGGNGGEPDAGRFLVAWAHRAGLTDVASGASVWSFSTPDDRTWWGSLWADRTVGSSFADQAITGGITTGEELGRLADAWLEWAAHPDGWFAVIHGEIIATKS